MVPDPPRQSASLTLAALPDGSSKEPLYTLALEIEPEWLKPGVIESATLDIDRYNGGALVKRLTYPISLDDLRGNMVTLEGLGDGLTLQGCTAQLNFVVKKDGRTMSVQNPVIVDP
jgi:hypothetical protein